MTSSTLMRTHIGYLSIFSQKVKPGLAQRGALPGGEGT